MDLKQIIGKLTKSEPLTVEELAFITNLDTDVDKLADGRAAAARHSAEQRLRDKDAEAKKLQTALDALQADADERANASKPELERLAGEIKKLQGKLADRDGAYTKLEGEQKAYIRGAKIDRLAGSLHFVPGIDPSLTRLAIERALADVGDEALDDEATFKPILGKFTAQNSAIMLDTSAGGAGTPPKGGPSATSNKALDKLTPDERRADLKKAGII